MFIGYQAVAAPAGVEQTVVALVIPQATQRAWVQASANNIRFTLNGVPAGLFHGMTLLVTQHPIWIEREDLVNIRFIAAVNAQLDISYYTTRNI